MTFPFRSFSSHTSHSQYRFVIFPDDSQVTYVFIVLAIILFIVMVAMISVICIKSGKKKLPPADVIPEVCLRMSSLSLTSTEIYRESFFLLSLSFDSTISKRKGTRTVTGTRTTASSKIRTEITRNIRGRKAPQRGWPLTSWVMVTSVVFPWPDR